MKKNNKAHNPAVTEARKKRRLKRKAKISQMCAAQIEHAAHDAKVLGYALKDASQQIAKLQINNRTLAAELKLLGVEEAPNGV